MFKCEKCGRVLKNQRGYTNHTKRCKGLKEDFICPKCNFIIPTSRNKHVNSCDGSGPRSKIKRRDGGYQWAKGKTYVELYGIEKADRRKNELRINYHKNKPGQNLDAEKQKLRSEKLRQAILKRYEAGWMPKAGRSKKIIYESKICGIVRLDGTWELLTAKYLDFINIKWERNTRRFSYINLKGIESKYTPDFYLVELDTYIEVKGYETALDRCKWEQFQYKIEIWKKDKMIELRDILGDKDIKF